MPFDPVTGRRADIVISPETPTNRMNKSQNFEHGMKAAMVELEDWLKEKTGLNNDTPALRERVIRLPRDIQEACFNRISRFLEITTDKHFKLYQTYTFEQKVQNLYITLKTKFYLWRPTDDPTNHLVAFQRLIDEGFLSPPRPVRFYNKYTKQFEETVSPHRIAPVYYICLEKIGEDAAAVATAATQPNGIISPLTNKGKKTQQTRQQATRFPSESENRTGVSGTPRGTFVEIHDRSNNPMSVEEALKTIYQSEKPTDIDVLIDRDKVPLGNSRPIQILRHLLECQGIEMAYSEFDPNQQALASIDPITGCVAKMDIENPEDEAEVKETKPRKRLLSNEEEQSESDEDDENDTDSDD